MSLSSSIKKIQKKSQAKRGVSLLLVGGILILIGVSVSLALFIFKPVPDKKSDVPVHEMAVSIAKSCSTMAGNWKNCYGSQFGLLSKQYDLETVLATLHEAKSIDARLYDCHIPAHKIMTEYVTKDVSKWEEYLDLVDPNECTYGFIHGILEARAQRDGTFILNEKTIPPFCETMAERKKGRGVDQTCSHIVGHLVLTQEYGDIPSAVAICEKIPEALQRECFGGLFMENYTRDNLVVHGIAQHIPWNEQTISEQETMCNTYSGNAGLGCWQQMSNLYAVYYYNDPEKVYTRCTRANQTEYTNFCYIQTMVSFMEIQDPTHEYYASLCARYVDEGGYYDMCTSYALGSLIHASIQLVDKAFLYCDSIPGTYQPLCYQRLGEAMSGRLSYEKQSELCDKRQLPETLKKSCLMRGGSI